MPDYSHTFTSDATANPSTPPNMTVQAGTFRNLNGTAPGAGTRASANGVAAQAVHTVAYGDSIQADVTLGTISAGDDPGACVMAQSGANTALGYLAYSTGTTVILAKLNGSGGWTDIGGSIVSYSAVAGDVLTCKYTKSTGALISQVNGTTKFSTTDATYQAESTLAAGMLVSAGNVNGSFITVFAGTGVSGSASQTPPAGSAALAAAAAAVISGAILTPLVARERSSDAMVRSRKIILPPWYRPRVADSLRV